MKKLFKTLRSQQIINWPIRKALRFLSYTFPCYIQRHLISRWGITGRFNVKLNDELSFQYYSRSDDNIANNLYYNVESYTEVRELILFGEFAKKSNVILDIGANTGLFSIVASVIHPDSKIWAFEPYYANIKRLQKNIALNKSPIEVITKAVGATNNKISFTIPVSEQISDVSSASKEFTESFYKHQVTYKQIEIDQISLDEFIEHKKLNRIDLIKIDVESYELEVFKGAKNLLKNFAPVIFCEMFVDESHKNFYEAELKPLGYDCFMIFKEGLIKTNFLINNPHCRNYLFIKTNSSSFFLSYSDMKTLMKELLDES
jgi:FkbM family methyltransferase